jgi:SulP family sulfate permease
MPSLLLPKLFTVLREGYTRKQFVQDLTAGLIVGVIALPLAIAFAIASGVKPEQGLYTAIIAGFLISALSGSRVQIGGPTGAFIVIVYGIVQQYGYDGLMIATFIAGILILAMGFARLGAVIQYIPYPVTVGFTTGIALIIFSGQVRDLFGLQMTSAPAEFVEKWRAYAEHFTTVNPFAIGIGLLSLALVIFWPKVTHRVPGSLIAILAATALVQIFNLPVETIGSRFGEVPSSLPQPHVPELSWSLFTKMFSPAITIALLAAIESLLSAVVADGMLGTRHRSNMELIAQGVANIASPIFGGIPATGAIARTAANIKNGGRTPIAGIIHALTLLLIMLFFGKWASLIPMATLAAILIFVAYNMSEWHLFLNIARSSPRSDVAVLFITFLLTVLIDLTVAIQVGVVLAAFLFMRRMAMVTKVGFVTNGVVEDDEDEERARHDPNAISKREVPAGVEVFEINGPFFFGAAEKFKDAMRRVAKPPAVLILRMRHVPALDATGLRVLEDVYDKARKEGTQIILSGIRRQPLHAMRRSPLLEKIGRRNVFRDLDRALNRAREILGLPSAAKAKPRSASSADQAKERERVA